MDEHGFESRLRHLEYIIVGQHNTKIPNEHILKRIDLLKRELDAVYKHNKPIKDFTEKYDAHSKLLNPATSTFSLEREILAPDVKQELLLAAQDDLEKFASEVKQVKALEHVVTRSEFDVIEKLGPQLAPLEVVHMNQLTHLNETTKDISVVLDKYNKTINTLSEIFISWDNILVNMEIHVTALERQKDSDGFIPLTRSVNTQREGDRSVADITEDDPMESDSPDVPETDENKTVESVDKVGESDEDKGDEDNKPNESDEDNKPNESDEDNKSNESDEDNKPNESDEDNKPVVTEEDKPSDTEEDKPSDTEEDKPSDTRENKPSDTDAPVIVENVATDEKSDTEADNTPITNTTNTNPTTAEKEDDDK
ncbi:hypothetical protein BDB01DRAFT_87392 [Pilobolus umbonatus]|nr:hypothetical protein BDB01DRAFT_87392 [Pilobolus umbonatus]